MEVRPQCVDRKSRQPQGNCPSRTLFCPAVAEKEKIRHLSYSRTDTQYSQIRTSQQTDHPLDTGSSPVERMAGNTDRKTVSRKFLLEFEPLRQREQTLRQRTGYIRFSGIFSQRQGDRAVPASGRRSYCLYAQPHRHRLRIRPGELPQKEPYPLHRTHRIHQAGLAFLRNREATSAIRILHAGPDFPGKIPEREHHGRIPRSRTFISSDTSKAKKK